MNERIIYHKDMIIISIYADRDEDVFFMKIGDKWSINKGKDLFQVIKAFELQDLSQLKDVYSKNAILHDLYDARMITKQDWENLM